MLIFCCCCRSRWIRTWKTRCAQRATCSKGPTSAAKWAASATSAAHAGVNSTLCPPWWPTSLWCAWARLRPSPRRLRGSCRDTAALCPSNPLPLLHLSERASLGRTRMDGEATLVPPASLLPQSQLYENAAGTILIWALFHILLLMKKKSNTHTAPCTDVSSRDELFDSLCRFLRGDPLCERRHF